MFKRAKKRRISFMEGNLITGKVFHVQRNLRNEDGVSKALIIVLCLSSFVKEKLLQKGIRKLTTDLISFHNYEMAGQIVLQK